jgi:hypothetical protein
MMSLSILFMVFGVLCVNLTMARMTENERVDAWHADKRNTWPPTWQQENENFKRAMEFREDELQMIPGARERWENYMQFTQSRMVPRFTPYGFKLRQTPEDVQTKLKERLDSALENYDKIRLEPIIDVLYTPEPSRFVDLHGLDWEVLRSLTAIHEEWAGMKLKPTSVYGIRLNSNQSSLTMHYDKVSRLS